MSEKEDQALQRFGILIHHSIDLSVTPIFTDKDTSKFFNSGSYSSKNITLGMFEYAKNFKPKFVDTNINKNPNINSIICYPDFKANKYIMSGYYNDSISSEPGADLKDYLKYIFYKTFSSDSYNDDSYIKSYKNNNKYYDFTSFNLVMKIALYQIYLKLVNTSKNSSMSQLNSIVLSYGSIIDTAFKYKYHSFLNRLAENLEFFNGKDFSIILNALDKNSSVGSYYIKLSKFISEFDHSLDEHPFIFLLNQYKIETALVIYGLYLFWLYCKKDSDEALELSILMLKNSGKRKDKVQKSETNEIIENPNEGGMSNEEEARRRQEIINDSIEFHKNKISEDMRDESSFVNSIYAGSKNWGSETGFDKPTTQTIEHKIYDKNDTLAKYANTSNSYEYKYKFNRKKMYKVYDRKMLPYNHRQNPKGSALILLDVSGSCVNYIQKFLLKIYSPKVISEIYYFDTKLLIPNKNNIISNKADLNEFIKDVPMGGGTDLNVPLQELRELKKGKFPPNIFVFTDGYMNEVDMFGYKGNLIIFSINEFMKTINDHHCKIIKIKIDDKELFEK